MELDVGLLALFVGLAASEEVADRDGHDLRFAHGFLFQHLIDGPRTSRELAELQGVSPQAVAKVVAELRRSGYLEVVPSEDARERPLALAPKGREAVAASRRARAAVDRRLRQAIGPERMDRLREDLAAVLDELGGTDDVRLRRVRLPS